MTQPSFKDIEILTAYLDGQLDAKQLRQVESRLQSDSALSATLEELRTTRTLFRRLPHRRAPRNFTLTPQMAGIRPPLPRTYPVLRFASALAAILFFFAFSANLIAPIAAQQTMLASAPMVGGMGGGPESAPERSQGGGGCDGCTSEPSIQGLAPAPSAEENPAEPTQNAFQADQSAPAEEPSQKTTGETMQAAPVTVPLAVSPAWMSVLLGLAVLAGGLALVTRYINDRKWGKAHAAPLASFSKREIIFIFLSILLIIAAAAGIVYFARAGELAQAQPAANGEVPMQMVESDGRLPPGDKGNAPTAAPQAFKLTPNMGYGFSYFDPAGRLVTIDFPAGVVDVEADALFSSEIGNVLPQNVYYWGSGFTLVIFPKELKPAAPITVTFSYTDADIAGVMDEAQLSILWWDGSNWIDAANTCPAVSVYERLIEDNQVRINACQFGTFILVGLQ